MNGKKVFLFVLVLLFCGCCGCCTAFADVVSEELPSAPDLTAYKDDYYTYSDYVVIRKTHRFSLTSGVHYNYNYYISYYNTYKDDLITYNYGGYDYQYNTQAKQLVFQLVDNEWVYCDNLPFDENLSSYSGSSSEFESITYYDVIYNSEPILYDDTGEVKQDVNKYYGNTDLSTVLSGEFSVSNIKDIFTTYKYLVPILIVVVIAFIGFRKAFIYFKNMLGA